MAESSVIYEGGVGAVEGPYQHRGARVNGRLDRNEDYTRTDWYRPKAAWRRDEKGKFGLMREGHGG